MSEEQIEKISKPTGRPKVLKDKTKRKVTKKTKVKKSKEKKPAFPSGFGATRCNLLGRLIDSAVDETKMPYILGIDQDELTEGMTLLELEEKYTGITHICDEHRTRIMNKIEQSMITLALGGVQVERRWDKDEEKWIPFKQKDVLPHFEACYTMLKLFRPDSWSDNKFIEDSYTIDGPLGAKASETEIKRLETFAGRLLESCTVRREVKLTVQEKVERTDVHEPGTTAEHVVDVEPKPDIGVQGAVLDVQPESTTGQEEPAVHNVADAGQSNIRD